MKNIRPEEAYEWLQNGEAILIDVREPDEFSAEHIVYASSVPLSGVEQSVKNMVLPGNVKIIMQCLKGKRGEQACCVMGRCDGREYYNIDGGIDAWKAAGLPVIGKTGPRFPIMRQVQMIVGGLILLLILMGLAGLTFGFILAGLFAGALAFAGLTGWCGLAMLLRHMPWNKK